MDKVGFEGAGIGVAPEVVEFAGVGDQVKEFAVISIVVGGKFVALVDVGFKVYGGRGVMEFADGVFPGRWLTAIPDVALIFACHRSGDGEVGGVEKRRGEVNEGLNGVGLSTGGDFAGLTDEEGDADAVFVVEGTFGNEGVVAVVMAVV